MSLDPLNGLTLSDYMSDVGRKARASSRELALLDAKNRNVALSSMAGTIHSQSETILEANQIDLQQASDRGLSAAMIDRLTLNDDRLDGIVKSVEAIAAQEDPLGAVLDRWTQPNGLSFSKVAVPIGVIGMIYESRPNVTVDAAALCLKSGNAVILRGGSEAVHTNKALYAAIQTALEASSVPVETVQFLMTQDRAAVGHMLSGLSGTVDLIIPRGGKGLVERVQTDARVPVLAHLDGLNHSYVHEDANLDMAESLVFNAKMRRTGVCGATETLLVDRAIADVFIPRIARALNNANCEIRGDGTVQSLVAETVPASENDYATEHLAPIINVKVVDSIDEALTHIATYGSGHTEAIVTENDGAVARFLSEVDSAIVLHNASTQFADGGEFGFGAEIGIATGRLHARGPVGAKHLTSYKYQVVGNGTIRP